VRRKLKMKSTEDIPQIIENGNKEIPETKKPPKKNRPGKVVQENKKDAAEKIAQEEAEKPKNHIIMLKESIKDVNMRLAQENTRLQQLQQALKNTQINIGNTQANIISLGGESSGYTKFLEKLKENK
jgi:hypothetical protein